MIDTHAHIDHIEDYPAALKEAREAGVEDIIAVSVDGASIKKNIAIQRECSAPRIHLAFGIHPGNIQPDEIKETLKFIEDNISLAKAVGEIGLDFWYKWARKDDAVKAAQREVFARQLMIARKHGLPVIVHTRGTWRECLQTTRLAGIEKALFHWYSGPVDVLEEILAAGYFVSASPSLAYSPQSREAISHAPLERTLIETDSPVFYRYRPDSDEGFQAAPKDVVRTLEAYCSLKNLDPAGTRKILNQNAKDFFNLG